MPAISFRYLDAGQYWAGIPQADFSRQETACLTAVFIGINDQPIDVWSGEVCEPELERDEEIADRFYRTEKIKEPKQLFQSGVIATALFSGLFAEDNFLF